MPSPSYPPVGSYPIAPPTTDILCGSLTNSTGLLIGIPPNRIWMGSVSCTVANFSSQGQVGYVANAQIITQGGTVVAPTSTVIVTAMAAVPSNVGNTTTLGEPSGSASGSAFVTNVVISAGSSSAGLALISTQPAGTTNSAGSAVGYLL